MRDEDDAREPPPYKMEEESFVRHLLVFLVWLIYLPVSFVVYRLRGGHHRLVKEQFAAEYPERTALAIETKRLPGSKVKRSVIRDSQVEDHTLDYNYRDEVYTWIET